MKLSEISKIYMGWFKATYVYKDTTIVIQAYSNAIPDNLGNMEIYDIKPAEDIETGTFILVIELMEDE